MKLANIKNTGVLQRLTREQTESFVKEINSRRENKSLYF